MSLCRLKCCILSNKMDFGQFCASFVCKINRLLKRSEHGQIEEIDLKKVSKRFGELGNYDLHQEELKPFVSSVYMFFQLVISYAKQFPDDTFHERQLIVKIALDTFSYVVDKTKTHSLIIKQFVKIIDNLIKEYGQYGFIQEFLIVYVGCLSKVEENTLGKLACKHKSLHLLANIAIDAQETSVQAAIIELVLKFSYNTESPLLERMFPEVKTSLVADPVNDYSKIRTILQQLNKNSTKIFSMNCTSIMLDHYLVSEFEGASSISEVWLDVDLPLKKLSFFCTPGFLSGFTDIRFGQAVDWEVLSFSVEDSLETTFTYNEGVENLEIDIKIRTSKFNLFRDLQFDTIRHLVIQISKYSKKYTKFVKDVMPQVFSNFPAENFAYTCKEVTSDDSTTNLFLQTSEESNRTVINRRYSDLDDTRLESVSVVDLTEDDEDEIEKQIQSAEVSINVTVEKTKWSRKQKMLDKSLSSVSFSETVLAGKPKSKLSRMSKIRKTSNRKKSKISTSKKIKPSPLKISTMTVLLTDHSPERDSPQINSKSECEKLVEQNVEQAPSNENNFEHGPFDDDLDLVVRDDVQESLELSQSKVENWLNTCMQSPVLLEGSPEFKTPEQPPVQVQYEGTPASNHSSNQPLDQRITKWLSEGHYEPSKTTREFITQKLSGRTESLLETLAKDDDNSTCIQAPVDMDVVTPTIIESKETERKEIRPLIETNIVNSEENKENQPNNSVDSESSNVPLAQLAGHRKKTSDDNLIIETRQDAELQIKLQRIDADKLDSYNETKAETEEDETSQKVNGVLSQTNKNSNTRSVSNKLSKTAASKQPRKSQKKAKNNVQNKKNLSIINEQISSAEASNRDLEDEQQEGSLSKQLFEYIIDKEVSETTNLSEPAVDKDTENHSPPTGNYVDIQKRPRKQTFRRRAEYLFDKLKNETTISMNTDTSAKNLSAKSNVADTSMAESRTGKRRLYNPNDLSYLENMVTDDYINSKPEEKIPVIEIKERCSSTKKAPPAKRGRKKKIEDLDVDFTKLKTTITERKTAEGTEKPFQKVIAEFKSQVKEHKEKKKMQKLINKSKRRGKKKVADSSPSTVSSPEPFGIPMETLLRKRNSDSSGEIPAKRVKEKHGSSKNINVISNILIKEADTLQSEPSNGKFDNLENPTHNCCRMYAEMIHRAFFEYITHTKRFNKKLFEEEWFRKIVNVIKKDFLHD